MVFTLKKFVQFQSEYRERKQKQVSVSVSEK